MSAKMPLMSIEERDRILGGLTEEQRSFLEEEMTRGRRTVFARQMACRKGAKIPENAGFEEIEHFVDGWIYLRCIDAGRVSKEVPCECGRPLRYQHWVRHKETGDIRKFGIDHLQLHTGIDAKTVDQILKGFNAVDLELSEMLAKVRDDWSLRKQLIRIPEGFAMPEDIRKHIELRLPLLDRQLSRLKQKIAQYTAAPLAASLPSPPRLPPPAPPAAVVPVQQEWDLFAAEALSGPEGTVGATETPISPQSTKFRSYSGPSTNDSPSDRTQVPKLSEAQKQAILHYLRDGVRSARIICELLIQKDQASDRRYSTEKPLIYFPVGEFIDTFVRAGDCRLIDKTSEDRHYEWR